MGVRNLLSHVSQICRIDNISNFKGQTVAIDASCFMYKALYAGCPIDSYMRKLVKSLTDQKIKVFLVFDGAPPPEKRRVLEKRKLRLSSYYVNNVKAAAWDYTSIIQAPGEADAQLAHLALTGAVDAVITEDSDLIVYGCPVVIY